MLGRFKLIFSLAVLVFASVIRAHAGEEASKKYAVSVAALFKNEEAFLKEWIEYHHLVGVDHFYLYDNGSTDRSRHVLRPYVERGLVTVHDWPDRVSQREGDTVAHWVLSTQLPAYEGAIKRYAVRDSEWLVFLDVDEFMVPVQADTVCQVLKDSGDYPGFELTCDFFDASEKDALDRKELLIGHVNLTSRPIQNILKSVEKTVFKPEYNTHFTWPPYKCNFEEGKVAGKLNRNQLRINKYVGRNNGKLKFEKLKQKLHVDSCSLTEDEKGELLEVGYQIEDGERLIHRFEPGLRKRMGIKPGWKWAGD
jgi:Glycosyltransferase family 92